MKEVIIILICLIACENQRQNQITNNILSNTEEYNLPINVSDMIEEIHFNGQSHNLTENECMSLNALSQEWLYEKYYSYNSFCYFKIYSNFFGVIFNRSYYPANIFEEKSEYILSIINKNNEHITNLPLQGSYGDDQVYFGTINMDYMITISREMTDENNNIDINISKYWINEDGSIEKLN